MKIVVLDGIVENPGDLSWDGIAALGEFCLYDRTSYTEDPLIAERLAGADIAITNKTPISAATIDACPDLKLIAVLATGYNVVDCAHARERGIPVVNVPDYSTKAVAQFAVGLLLQICGMIGPHAQGVREGRWSVCRDFSYWDWPIIELAGKTAGIIGLGRIGKATARILRAMDMRVLAAGSRPTDEGRALAEYTDLDTLLAESDVIFLHCPLFPETADLIRAENIAKMKDGVIVINNGRGGLVNERDLADALESGKVYAAGLDVAKTEPIDPASPLLTAKNCFVTPHISWAATEARQRIMDITEANIRAFLAGTPQNVVNG